MKHLTIEEISKRKVSFFNNDFRINLNNRDYEITAIHGVDKSTQDEYSSNPDCVKVSLIELEHKRKEERYGRTMTGEQMIKSGAYIHGKMLHKETVFTVIESGNV